jgi:N-glycosylase/DNA lyase
MYNRENFLYEQHIGEEMRTLQTEETGTLQRDEKGTPQPKGTQVHDFHLDHTIESGQIFAYEPEDGGYRIIDGEQTFWVKQEGDSLLFTGTTESFVRKYFRLDEDHQEILLALEKHKQLAEAIRSYRGLRLIRQDPWQCTVGFLCSQNSNIPRIKNNIRFLINTFGNGKFPSPSSIDQQRITEARLGYREQYIVETSKLVNKEFFERLRTLPYEDAKEALMTLPGVGPKVADCILLFSLDHLNAFPVDVWIANVMKELFPSCRGKTPAKIAAYAQRKFGAHAGYAQQYLYHWKRNQ